MPSPDGEVLASELIAMLQEAIKDNGDLPVCVTGAYGSSASDIEVEVPKSKDSYYKGFILITTSICSG